jgi:hypothetical protein
MEKSRIKKQFRSTSPLSFAIEKVEQIGEQIVSNNYNSIMPSTIG